MHLSEWTLTAIPCGKVGFMGMEITPHPDWLQKILEIAAPYEATIVDGRYFGELAKGELSGEEKGLGSLFLFHFDIRKVLIRRALIAESKERHV